MSLRALLAGMLFAGLLSACAVIDPVDHRYDTVSRSLARARNEAIFLNLVRASHDYPLAFTAIANVSPSISNTTSLGLPNFLVGPRVVYSGSSAILSPGRDVVFNNTTASNSTLVSTNFNVSTEETSAFYEGFLKPIDLTTLAYFIRQGYSRELLFWLFTDSFELTSPKGVLGFHYDPPDDLGCDRHDPKHRCFVDWVHNAALTGLTVEEQALQRDGAGRSSGGGAKSPSAAKPTTFTFARFCFNRVLAEEAVARIQPQSLIQQGLKDLDVGLSQLYAGSLTCGSSAWKPETTIGKPQPDILPLIFDNGAIKFRIIPRSAYGVFKFLGTLMKLERQHYVPDPRLYPASRPWAVDPPTLATVSEDHQLLTVVQNLGGECFVHTWFDDGDYCVPEQATTTKRIFGLLAQLIAIQTAASDLSITPIVRVIQ